MQETPYPDIPSNQWTKYSENCEVFYLSREHENKSYIRNLVGNLDFDLCYLNGIFSKVYSIWPLDLIGDKKCILAPRGMLRSSALAIKSFKKKAYLSLARIKGSYKNVHFQGTTDDEAKDILAQKLSKHISVASNCPRIVREPIPKEKENGVLEMVFAGRIAKEKNLLFALQCLQEADFNGIRLKVIGEKYDQDYFLSCKSVSESLQNIDVQFLGSLAPEEFEKELQKAHLMFLPTLGENYGHVIYESLINGTPVLISDQTPWLGLAKSTAGFELALSEKESFAEKIKFFLSMDNDEYQNYYRGAISYAKKKIDLETIRTEYIRLFE